MRKLSIFLFCVTCFFQVYSQAPQSLRYQAVARNQSGQVLIDTSLPVRMSVLTGSSTGTAVYVETHNSSTNSAGILSLMIGSGTVISGNFQAIDWSSGLYYMQIEAILPGESDYTVLGTNQLLSVPFALYAQKSNQGPTGSSSWVDGQGKVTTSVQVGIGTSFPQGMLAVQGTKPTTDTALFEVKDSKGNTVFAVYEDGVQIIVNEGVKGGRGGFAVGGRRGSKASYVEDIMRVTPDSVRIYINDTSMLKGGRGGFAVGGRKPAKGTSNEFLRVTPDSTRIYINEPLTKGGRGGFAVGGRKPSKGTVKDYFNISTLQSIDTVKSQPRILWYPKKEAFLTGRVLVESSDSVGTNSMATGFESKAIGNWSQALGYQAIARGNYSSAIGENAKAIAEGSYAFGTGTEASGLGSIALGFIGKDSAGISTGNTKATATYSVAIGMGAQATKVGAFAIGTQSKASGGYSFAIGYKSISNQYYATALGLSTNASGSAATAIGAYSLASGGNSTALGYSTKATGFGSTAMGYNSMATQFYATAMGYLTKAGGYYATAMGNESSANGSSSTATGYKTIAQGDNSVSMGYSSSAVANYSISLGANNTSAGDYSVTIGNRASAGGNSATALGSYTTANGWYSTAMGYNTNANQYYSTAMGSGTVANGNFSTAMGNQTSANGEASISMGFTTLANAKYSATMGYNTKAYPYASLVIGQFNDTTFLSQTQWNTSDAVFIIGNGTSAGSRNNALTAYKNGNITINGTLTQLSDIRLKENILGLAPVKASVLKLHPVSYEFRDKNTYPAGRQIGFIAQEVQKIFPEMVHVEQSGFLSVDYTKMSVILLQAMKEQQQFIEGQDTRIQSLEEQNNKLQGEMITLRDEMNNLKSLVRGNLTNLTNQK